MGNPVRFFGSGREHCVDGSIIPARCTVEVTFRAFDEQLLLKPSPETTAIILGCFARALPDRSL